MGLYDFHNVETADGALEVDKFSRLKQSTSFEENETVLFLNRKDK